MEALTRSIFSSAEGTSSPLSSQRSSNSSRRDMARTKTNFERGASSADARDT